MLSVQPGQFVPFPALRLHTQKTPPPQSLPARGGGRCMQLVALLSCCQYSRGSLSLSLPCGCTHRKRPPPQSLPAWGGRRCMQLVVLLSVQSGQLVAFPALRPHTQKTPPPQRLPARGGGCCMQRAALLSYCQYSWGSLSLSRPCGFTHRKRPLRKAFRPGEGDAACNGLRCCHAVSTAGAACPWSQPRDGCTWPAALRRWCCPR